MMMRRAILNVSTVVLAAAGLAATVSAQQQTTPPPTPPAQTTPAQDPTQQTALGQLPPVDKYVVGTAKPPLTPGTTMVDMTLEQAIQIALDHNLDLQSAKLNPQIQDYALQSARAVFRPSLTGSYNYSNSHAPSTNTTEGQTSLIQTTDRYNTGVTQPLPWYGGSYSVSFNNTALNTNNLTSPRNPQFNSSLQFSYTQPILANFAIDSNRTNIITNQIQREITDISLLATIENTKASVRSAYWSLKAAIERIEISQRAVDQAQQLLDNDKQQVAIGTMAQIETAQPESQVASAQVSLLAAQISWQTAELAFKRLLVTGRDDDLYKKTINPVDVPAIGAAPSINIDAAVQTAVASRTDIQTARKSMESTEASLKLTRNQTLPSLNVTGGFTNAGLGGPVVKSGVVTTPGGYGDAFNQVFTFNQPTWNVQFNFTYPIGMVQQHANLARAELQFEQTKATLKTTELSVATDVLSAGLNVQNTYQQYLASKKAREAQEQATDAERTRMAVGLSNNYNVVLAQNSLTSARLTELTSLINYINALADYDRKQRIGGGSSASAVGGSTGSSGSTGSTGSTGGGGL